MTFRKKILEYALYLQRSLFHQEKVTFSEQRRVPKKVFEHRQVTKITKFV